MTANEIASDVCEGRMSALEITRESLRPATTVGRDLNAFITICEMKALAQAEAVDRLVRSSALTKGESAHHSLAGVPVAIKDNICYRDYPTTCASRMLRDFVPPFDPSASVRKFVRIGFADQCSSEGPDRSTFDRLKRLRRRLEMHGIRFRDVSANSAGLPAISVPCGWDGNGCPFTVHAMARPFGEATLKLFAHVVNDVGGDKACHT